MEALDTAKKNIKHTEIELVNSNVLKFILRNEIKYDHIYLFGLLDYFNLDDSKKILNKLMKSLQPGGNIFFTNVSQNNHTKCWMEYVTDWFLCEKSKSDIDSMLSDVENVDEWKVSSDPYNVYNFIEIQTKH